MNKKLSLLLDKKPLFEVPFWENTSSKIFIYGTGGMAQSVYRVLTESGLVVSGFLDHRVSANPFLNGLPILAPENASGSIVVIGIHNRDAEIPPIVERVRDAGAVRIITLIELYDFFSEELGVRYWLTRRDYYHSFKSLIEKVDLMWADEVSRSLYGSILDFRINGDYSVLPAPDLDHQYFPPDIPAWEKPLRFVDCGAFDGDTLRNFLKSEISVEAVSAFEPDENNFRKLSQFIYANQECFQSVGLWPCGVSFATHQLSFDAGNGEASAVSSGGNTMIQCVSLDEAIPNFMPNLIKMDIEGAEPDALLGARNLIQKSYPSLAISIYHRPEHLWQIPLLVESMAMGHYQYFLRAHGFNDFDVVLYCIPLLAKK